MQTFLVTTGHVGFDLEVDAELYDAKLARKHCRELKDDFGCECAKVRKFADVQAAEEWRDKHGV